MGEAAMRKKNRQTKPPLVKQAVERENRESKMSFLGL